jgi:hydroxyacylglutathione hydrolase
MRVFAAAAPPFMKNGYVVAGEKSDDAVVIDPGDEVGDLLAMVARHELRPTAILLTHAHLDHVTGVAQAKRELGVDVHLHKDDLFLYNGVVEQGAMFGLRVDPQPPIDHFYTPAQIITFGDCIVDVHHTPGHCPGGVCLAIRDTAAGAAELFVGDTLFAGSIGRTDLPGGDHATLIASIRRVLFAFPDDSIVHSGHGPDTTIGHERKTNPFLVG